MLADIAPVAQRFLRQHQVTLVTRDVVERLMEGEVSREDYDTVISARSSEETMLSRAELIDFVLHYIEDSLSDHILSESELENVRYLKRLFRVSEGAFLEFRQDKVTELLGMELKRILTDRLVDPTEALHKVDLQDVFDLGYDEFAELVRPQVQEVLLYLASKIDEDGDGIVNEEDLLWYQSRVAALDIAYDLNPSVSGATDGYIYLLVNPSMDGLVKVGKTTRDPRERAEELSSVSGVPTPFILVYSLHVADCAEAERQVHQHLEDLGCRVPDNREFFRVSPEQAIEFMIEAQTAGLL